MTPLSISDLPSLNALLNGISAVLITAGYVFIRNKQVLAHRNCMIGAFATSTLFLISYLTYHYHTGSHPFPGEGWIRMVYFTILISHTVLATLVVPFVLTTLYRAARQQFDRHVRIARWTLPIWWYVSVTGVVVYWMLYRMGG